MKKYIPRALLAPAIAVPALAGAVVGSNALTATNSDRRAPSVPEIAVTAPSATGTISSSNFFKAALTSASATAATTAAVAAPITVTTTVNLKSDTIWASPAVIKVTGGLGIKVKGTISNSTIGPVEIIGAKQSVYFDAAAIVRNLSINGLTVTDTLREGIRIQGDVDGVTVTNFSLKQVSTPAVSPDLPTGIAMYQGKNIKISDGTASGFQMINTGYPNGDGISSERAVDRLTISRVTSNDNSDGGFDLKSTNSFLYDLNAARNYRNYRFWGGVQAGILTSTDAANAHVWTGEGATVVIDKLIAKSKTKAVILYVDGAKSVTIKACTLDVPAGTKLLYKATASSVVTLGPGCTL